MNCPKCNGKSKTKDTRKKPGMIMRRHECFECHHRFTTYEIWADDYDSLKEYEQVILFLKNFFEQLSFEERMNAKMKMMGWEKEARDEQRKAKYV